MENKVQTRKLILVLRHFSFSKKDNRLPILFPEIHISDISWHHKALKVWYTVMFYFLRVAIVSVIKEYSTCQKVTVLKVFLENKLFYHSRSFIDNCMYIYLLIEPPYVIGTITMIRAKWPTCISIKVWLNDYNNFISYINIANHL